MVRSPTTKASGLKTQWPTITPWPFARSRHECKQRWLIEFRDRRPKAGPPAPDAGAVADRPGRCCAVILWAWRHLAENLDPVLLEARSIQKRAIGALHSDKPADRLTAIVHLERLRTGRQLDRNSPVPKIRIERRSRPGGQHRRSESLGRHRD